jgi:PEP-CTERM motif
MKSLSDENVQAVGRLVRMSLVGALLAIGLAGAGARGQTTVSVGYYDLPPSYGNPNPVPSPWYGSPNTTFLGNTTQAAPYPNDPDEAAILFTNIGATAVTLDSGLTVGSLTLWNSLITAGGTSIGPGDSVILSGTIANAFDGSDIPLIDSTISFSLNGTAYSVVDTGSILDGFPAYDETEPWTQVDEIGGSAITPEPASMLLFATGILGIAFITRRKLAH